MSLMSLYIAVATHFNDMAEELRKIDLEAYDNAKINLQLRFEDLEDIETLVTEAKLYPTESSTIGAIKEAPVTTTPARPVNPLLAKLNTVQNSKANNIPYATVTSAESTMTEYQKAKMALNGGTAPVINEIPSLHNYRGPRPDLHVANIYNAAQPYNPYLNNAPVQQTVQVQYDQYGRPIVPQVQTNYNPHLNNVPQEVNHYNGTNTTSRVHVSFSERLQQEQAQKNPYLNRY
jgi:hypothetical protein